MVFSSLEFIYLFLPLVVIGYHLLCRFGFYRAAPLFLFSASVFYYGYWNPANTWLILASIVVNYLWSMLLFNVERYRKPVLIMGIALNLGALCYYKYTDFFLGTANELFGAWFTLQHIVLPIGISFFTFQQIAFLVDVYQGKMSGREGLSSYSLFVCFFPQLVAGPIVHHREMMPQFSSLENRRFNWDNIYAGLVMFFLGLGKKVMVADSLSPVVGYCFDTSASLSFAEAWLGSLAYTLQLYFDFSGYSDMAIGCALLFNIHLPQNFLSPYKASNIQEFWRSWHITLSRWLRDYLYIPLGGNRKGERGTLRNLFITFLLGGLWHGAGWTFVAWGFLHGTALCLHRVWSRWWGRKMPRVAGVFVTLMFVNFAWVVFRATSFSDALKVYGGMLGQNGWVLGEAFTRTVALSTPSHGRLVIPGIVFLLGICLWGPNSTELTSKRMPHLAMTAWVTALGLSSLLLFLQANRVSEFIYFQF
ncbi:MBOAT family O-acyltransferase [Desulfovibrio ferrophilus]|uniref:Membrane bound O-acyl transferase MBOAT family protein n=1 Tax=Desulfovibrio ferrophilus TaxID=241368 RepID=A0A2Z6B236_9BACT|nr:MBOAT family protein [Desulfovibrio ferrophilus]BBD09545.1 membrane bound O-acyl transferase MBOAT family protein [Desulfovibrio ferrophilus]